MIEKEDGLHVLFEVRSLELRRQPGEICFPGGRVDENDINEKEAAIRETIEELGLSREKIKGIFPLDYMVSPFGMIIYPFAGIIDSIDSIHPNPSEVGEVFTVPITYFLAAKPKVYHINFKVEPEESFPFDLIAGGENYDWSTRRMDEYFYHYHGRTIWGLTARILSHFIGLIQEK